MATTARGIHCDLKSFRSIPVIRSRGNIVRALPPPAQVGVAAKPLSTTKNAKIMLQPRLCTLRSYGSEESSDLVMKTKNDVVGDDDAVSFFATLSDYIDSSKKSQDFEIVSGRLAMVVFAATVTMEVVTGNSLFGKVETKGIAEAEGVGVAAVMCAVVAAWMSSNRTRVGGMFTLGCNSFIDSLIDQIVDGLFYETDITNWSDDV